MIPLSAIQRYIEDRNTGFLMKKLWVITGLVIFLGGAVARGMYFIRIVDPDIDEIRKVMVVR